MHHPNRALIRIGALLSFFSGFLLLGFFAFASVAKAVSFLDPASSVLLRSAQANVNEVIQFTSTAASERRAAKNKTSPSIVSKIVIIPHPSSSPIEKILSGASDYLYDRVGNLSDVVYHEYLAFQSHPGLLITPVVQQPRTLSRIAANSAPSSATLAHAALLPVVSSAPKVSPSPKLTLTPIPSKTLPLPTVQSLDTAYIRQVVLSVLNENGVTIKNQKSPTLAAFIDLAAEFRAIKEKVNRNVFEQLGYNPNQQVVIINAPTATTTEGTGGTTDFQGRSVTASGNITGGTFTGGGLTNCTGSSFLQWNSSTGQFGCSSAGASSGIKIESSGTTSQAAATIINFDAGAFDLIASGSTEDTVKLDWVNGPASLSANETVGGLWTFAGGASVTTNFELVGSKRLGINAGNTTDSTLEVGGTASISGATTLASTLTVAGGTTLSSTLGVTGLATLTNASLSASLELTSANSKLGINAGNVTDTMLEVGGTASISGATTLASTLTITGGTTLSSTLGVTGLSTLTNASLSASLELTSANSRLGINSGGRTDTMFEVGGTASISGATTLASTLGVTGLTTLSGGASVGANFELTGNFRFGINAGNSTEASLEVGGTASISGAMTLSSTLGVTGLATLTNASLSSSLDLTSANSRLGINSGGRTDTMFEIGGTASISGATTLASTLGVSGLTSLTNASLSSSLELTSTNSRLGINPGGSTTAIFEISDTTSQTTNIASISATALTTGDVFAISVPASSTRTIGILTVTAGNVVVASLGNSGRLSLRNAIFTHAGGSSACTGSNAPSSGCIDYAENFPTTDASLMAGELAAVDPQNSSNVIRAAKGSSVIGVVSTNPATVITGSDFVWGALTAERRDGFVPLALAGRVPVKISLENGFIKPGDHLALSSTQPGYAMKATDPGITVGIALEPATDTSQATVMTFVNLSYWMPELDSTTDIATPSFLQTILQQLASLFNVVIQKGIIQTVTGIFKNVELEQGATILDRATGQPYCLAIENGQVITTPGKCGQSATTPSNGEPAPSSEVTPAATPDVTPSEILTPSVAPTESPILEIPSPSPDVSPESTPVAQ